MTVRGLLVWLVTLPLAIVGSQLAHAWAYRLVTPDADVRAHELAASGHGYLRYATLGVTVCLVVVAVALACEVVRLVSSGGPSRSPSPWRFALLGPTIFAAQEHLERLVHGGSFPWGAVADRTFVLGLLLQLPAAGIAYLFARVLLRAARTLGRLLASLGRSRLLSVVPMLAVAPERLPRLPAVSLGYASRGPPASA